MWKGVFLFLTNSRFFRCHHFLFLYFFYIFLSVVKGTKVIPLWMRMKDGDECGDERGNEREVRKE